MKLGRKEAIFTAVASVVGLIAGRVRAQAIAPPAPPPPSPSPLQDQIDELRRRLEQLDDKVLVQPTVGFTKLASGDLVLNAPRNVTINAPQGNLTLAGIQVSANAVASVSLNGQGTVTVTGALITLN